jgi:hypothetical protein
MYRQARFYIRTALVWLFLASFAGALPLLNQSFAIDGRIGALQPAFYHMLMVGWATQLIGGAALWTFPPYTRAARAVLCAAAAAACIARHARRGAAHSDGR